jgi:hypothetical protein
MLIKKKGILIESDATNQIFTQLLYRNLPNENIQYSHWLTCCIVLDKKILKDYPFYATNIGGFYTNFSDAFAKHTKDAEDTERFYMKSNGNLKKMPNLKKLKIRIEEGMRLKKTIDFIHSHEILFNKRISLKKYCKCILYRNDINDEIPNSLITLAEKLKIPIKRYGCDSNKFIGYGLNNFIDLIEK